MASRTTPAEMRFAQYSAAACAVLVLLMRKKSSVVASTLLHTGGRAPLSGAEDGSEAWTQDPWIWFPMHGVAVGVAEAVGVAAAAVLQRLRVVVMAGSFIILDCSVSIALKILIAMAPLANLSRWNTRP